MRSRIEVLQYLAMHGIGQIAELEAEVDVESAGATLESLKADGLVEEDGFWYLTPSGETRLDKLCRERFSPAQIQEIEAIFFEFEELDQQFKSLSETWQNAPAASEDANQAIEELTVLHTDLKGLFSELESDTHAVYAQYLDRLETAHDRIRDGETTFFTGTDVESYHNVWFELHDDLLRTLGRERNE